MVANLEAERDMLLATLGEKQEEIDRWDRLRDDMGSGDFADVKPSQRL